MNGNWADNFGYTWTLQQTGTTITGSVDFHEEPCGPYNVNGTVDNSGNITLTATGTTCPAQTITWTFSNAVPGCNSNNANAHWVNDLGAQGTGDWSWSKPCDKPDYELASNFLYWEDTFAGGDPTVAWWSAKLGSNSGLLFGGRTVSEQDGGGGVDGCYFTGSLYGPQTMIPNSSTTVQWDETYIDRVGPSTTLTNYYREQRPAHGLSALRKNLTKAAF